jgi:lysozyme
MSSINAKGLALIRDFEGFSAVAYLCPAGVWTIGYGFTQGVKEGDKITREAADARLAYEVGAFATGVANLITRPANENELAAMTSLAFNTGLAAFGRSTVLRAHNRGDTEAAARAFGLWNKAGGKTLRGLTRRRSAEAALYLEPVRVKIDIPAQPLERMRIDPEDAMPQRIDPERTMGQSTIVRGSSVAGGVASLTLAAEGARAVGDIKYSLGDWLPYVALGIIAVAAAYVIYERVKQRRGGWA